jgi:ketosteroid isomerase-like protein
MQCSKDNEFMKGKEMRSLTSDANRKKYYFTPILFASLLCGCITAPKQAVTDVSTRFAAAFAARDADALLQLFESEALMKPSPDGPAIRGHAALRKELQAFMDANPKIETYKTVVYENTDLALMRSKWRILGEKPIEGESLEVLRRQTDGSWKYVIDLPFGR